MGDIQAALAHVLQRAAVPNKGALLCFTYAVYLLCMYTGAIVGGCS